MNRIGSSLIAEKKATILKELAEDGKREPESGRDLLSLLLKANIAADEHQRLSDDDVLARMSPILSFHTHLADTARPQRSRRMFRYVMSWHDRL